MNMIRKFLILKAFPKLEKALDYGLVMIFQIKSSSTNPGYTLSSSSASFHQQKSSSTGLQQKYAPLSVRITLTSVIRKI
mgnify:FL=1